jgi:hypothetical protein
VRRVRPVEAIFCALGAAAISVGVALIFLPAGIIVAGIFLLLIGLLVLDDGGKR